MSIVAPSDRGQWWAAKGPCFLCRERVDPEVVMVMWDGSAAVEVESDRYGEISVGIALHAECARKLGAHLIGDAREADLADGRTVVWARRAERLKKTRIEREEWMP